MIQNLTLFNNPPEKLKIGVEIGREYSKLRMAFSIPIVPVDEDLSAFFISKNNTLLITSRGPLDNSVIIAENSRVPCRLLKSKEFAEILKCEFNNSNPFSPHSKLQLEVQRKDSNLSYKLPIRKDAIIKSPLATDGKTFKKYLPFKHHHLSSGSYLEIFGIPKSLGHWLLKENGIIDCDFLTGGHSTVGKLLSAKRILCPVTDDDIFNFLHIEIQIVDNQINIAISEKYQKTPSYPTYFRLLSSSDSFYALSPLDPIIIMDPAESEEVNNY